MAQSVIWSQEALDDIDSIAAYIHRDSPRHAQRVAEEILALGSSISEQPRMGRVVPEVEDEAIRERFIYSYRVIYEIQPTQIEVLAVIHGRRLLESIADRLP
jgi:plasmid stabilization system protein ParE